MQLRSLTLLNVRNLRTPKLAFEAGVIAFVGQNAAGKSNLLAAAYLGCTGTLPAGTITETVALGQAEAFVEAAVEHDEGLSRIAVGLAPGRKVLRIDGQSARTADVARICSAVLVTPQDADLVHGSPSGRRAYLDDLLARISPRYGGLTREYQRVLEQRNALLRVGRLDPSLDVWTERFLLLGHEIDGLRARAVDRIERLAAATYAEVAADGKALAVQLQRKAGDCELAQALVRHRAEERARGTTVVGPHRDDLVLLLDGQRVQGYGSRGEARTTALALRVAEYRLLHEKHAEPPVLLIDDFTAELDESRRDFLLRLAAGTPQAFVSGTEAPPHADSLWSIRDGTVTHG